MGVKKAVKSIASIGDIFKPDIPKAARPTPSVAVATKEEDKHIEEASRKAKAALVSGRAQTLLTSGTGGLGGLSTVAPKLLGGG